MSTLRKTDTRIPRRPLLWLAAALVFTVPPMFNALAIWVPLLFLATLAAKFWMEPKGYRLRFPALKLILTSVAVGAIFVSYGTIKGIEPGVSLIAVLMSLKILEAHTAREFQIMVLVGWVLCLCGFFLAQDLSIALCVLVAFTLLVVALTQFHRGSAPGAFWPVMRTGGKLVAQAIPVIVVLFLFFPRISTGVRFLMTLPASAASGFSDRVSPGSVASLANSSEVAFRAEFPDGKLPRADALYWRGVVMSRGDGMEWRASEAPAAIPASGQRAPAGESIRQWITIEPHGARWMFALDWPAQAPPGATLAPGNYLWSGQSITKPRRYEVRSFPRIEATELRPRERDLLLQVPESISPAVRELATSWTAGNAEPRTVVANALRYFQTQGFRYSLSPGEYRKNDLEEFLFRRRIGFCEHYAGTFATLMRLARVPARVVVGYLGGEFNQLGRFFVVRQSDTHAWCEVWLPDSGWVRVDPTSVVAPDRVNLGFESFLQRGGASSQTTDRPFAARLARQPIFINARLAWQSLNYAWDTRVLSFDTEAQESFAAAIGIGNARPVWLLLVALAGTAVLAGAYAAWARLRSASPPDRVRTLYERFCRSAARRGAERSGPEGPADFARRAASLLPAEADRIGRISRAYIALRYASDSQPDTHKDFADEVKAFANRR
jgi:transglutaminase-like putative cysteine protease